MWTLEDRGQPRPGTSTALCLFFVLYFSGNYGELFLFPGEFCLTCGNNANELKRRLPPPRLSQSGPQKYETFEVKSSRDKPLHPAVLPPATVIPPLHAFPPLDMRGKVFKDEEEKIPVARSWFVFASTLERLSRRGCFSPFPGFTISILRRRAELTRDWDVRGVGAADLDLRGQR